MKNKHDNDIDLAREIQIASKTNNFVGDDIMCTFVPRVIDTQKGAMFHLGGTFFEPPIPGSERQTLKSVPLRRRRRKGQPDSFSRGKKGKGIMDLQHLRGKSVSRIRRLYYVYQGMVDTREGALELRFHDGSFLLLDTNSDWTLRVKQEEWSDPFAPPLSDENADFIRTSGKWAAFDISNMMPACLCIGRQLSAYREILSDESGMPESIGIILAFDELAVKASSYGGEIRVEWTSPDFSLCDLPSTLVPA